MLPQVQFSPCDFYETICKNYMNIIVDIKNYTPFTYSPYLERGNEAPMPKNPKYVVGQVVVVNHEDKLQMAVVLGCIDTEFDGEVRLDLCGMTCVSDIRPASKSDLKDPNIECCDKLRAECEGKIVHYNWKTYELTIEEPNKI